MLKAIKNNLPNAITCLNLLCGVLAVVASFSAYDEVCCGLLGYELAVILIALGAVADFCDGLVARALGAVSPIGKELDSLSDLVSFGLAPALLMFNVLQGFSSDNEFWFAMMLIPVFGAIRLARFNIDTEQSTTFKGLPIPANAVFWLGLAWFLAIIHLAYREPGDDWMPAPSIIVLLAVFFSWLMVSDVPMFSFKLHSLSPLVAWRQYLLVVMAIVLFAVFGVSGMALLILLYVVMCIGEAVFHLIKK